MGYIVALVLILVVVPLLFALLSRRTPSGGGAGRSRDRGVTVSQPSADAPTARVDAINQPAAGAEKRLPPG